MEPLGIIGGSAFVKGGIPDGTEERVVETERGEVVVHVGERYVFLRRHGHRGYRPPHEIPHHAHVLALEELGVRRAVALCSVGALDPRVTPGCVVVPDDYLSWLAPPTFAVEERLHIVPHLDRRVRAWLLGVAREVAYSHDAWLPRAHGAASQKEVRDGGAYVQTHGPRFETRAEIRMLADYADVVGMTAASEATLLQERGIRSAILGIVDNYAHGIDAKPLTLEAFDAQLEKNAARARALLAGLIAAAPDLLDAGAGT